MNVLNDEYWMTYCVRTLGGWSLAGPKTALCRRHAPRGVYLRVRDMRLYSLLFASISTRFLVRDFPLRLYLVWITRTNDGIELSIYRQYHRQIWIDAALIVRVTAQFKLASYQPYMPSLHSSKGLYYTYPSEPPTPEEYPTNSSRLERTPNCKVYLRTTCTLNTEHIHTIYILF